MTNGPMSDHIVISIGEVNLDISVSVEGSLTAVAKQRRAYLPIEHSVGGTAGNFVIAARDYFREVRLLTRLGRDTMAELIRAQLDDQDIKGIYVADPVHPTRVVISIEYAKPGTLAERDRLMLASPESPAYQLDRSDVDRITSWFGPGRLLMMDTYSILREPVRSTAKYAISRARQAGCVIALDIVPHDIYQTKSLAEIHSFAADADFLIVELPTLAALLGLPQQQTTASIRQAMKVARRGQFEFGARYVLLRFGIGNNDQTLILGPRAAHVKKTDFLQLGRSPRFGDRLSAQELALITGRSLLERFGYERHSLDTHE